MYSIYTYYDKDNKPLYIGKSTNLYKRHNQHRRDEWFADAVKIGIRNYNNHQEMDIAEIHYTATRDPLFNVQNKLNNESRSKGFIIELVDATEEEILTLESFCNKYGPSKKHVGMRNKNKRTITAEEKLALYHDEMSKKFGEKIIECEEPTLDNVSAIFLDPSKIIRVGDEYYGFLLSFPTDRKKPKGVPHQFSEESRKQLISAWRSAGKDSKAVLVRVKSADEYDYMIPAITHYSIDSEGWIAIGSVSVEYCIDSKAFVWELPALVSVVQYIKTRDESLLKVEHGKC